MENLMCKKIDKAESGFTLIELMIVSVVFLIVIAMAAGLVQLGQFDLRTNKNAYEVQQYTNAAMKFMERDITNSGQGYLQGSSTGSVNGPLVSTVAFRNITGINPPVGAPNSLPLFSLVPLGKADNLGNGATS